MMTDRRRIVVTGIGLVSPFGTDLHSFWRRCLQGDSIVETIPDHWSKYYSARSQYWVPLRLPDYLAHGLSRIDLTTHDPATLNAIVAADIALREAGLLGTRTHGFGKHSAFQDYYDPDRVGVFVGTGLGIGLS